MKMNHNMTRYARKVKGKLTAIFDPEHLATLARAFGDSYTPQGTFL
jgi:hypothetical protein